MIFPHGLLEAAIFHQRESVAANAFTYKSYYLASPLSTLASLSLPFYSYNRFNILSFHDKDHGARDGGSLEAWIESLLEAQGLTDSCNGEVVMVAHPRVLGHVFNPVSFWFCLDSKHRVRAVLAEVNNTFGESHSYLLFHPDHRPIEKQDILTSDKAFHVSPFFDVVGSYTFRFHITEEHIGVWIDYWIDGKRVLQTSMLGKCLPLDNRNTWRCFWRYPLVTLRTLALIHWQAFKLWRKGVRYRNKPPQAEKRISIN